MKNVLITGVAGFIGSHVSRRLIAEGYRVVGLDDLSTGWRYNIAPEVEFHDIDLREIEALADILKDQNFDTVVHLAAQSGGEPSMRDPSNDASRNILATVNLIQILEQHPPRRFLFASSAAVYGDSRSSEEKSDWKSPSPNSFYGISKLASETYLSLFAKRTGTLVSTLRLFNVYGPGQDLSRFDQGMISIYLSQMLKGRKVTIKGSSHRVRDFVYVSDVVDAFMLCAEKSQVSGTFDVCTGTSTTVQQVLDRIAALLDQELEYEEIDGTQGDSLRWFGDPSPLTSELGWRPEVDLTTGLTATVAWALSVTP